MGYTVNETFSLADLSDRVRPLPCPPHERACAAEFRNVGSWRSQALGRPCRTFRLGLSRRRDRERTCCGRGNEDTPDGQKLHGGNLPVTAAESELRTLVQRPGSGL